MSMSKVRFVLQTDAGKEIEFLPGEVRGVSIDFAKDLPKREPDPSKVPLGLSNGELVCPCADDQEVEAGAVPARCSICKCVVAIAREHVRLFGGKDEPPAVVCRPCCAERDQKYWVPVAIDVDPMIQDQSYNWSQTFENTYTTSNTQADAVSDMKRMMEKLTDGFDVYKKSWEAYEPYLKEFQDYTLAKMEHAGQCQKCGSLTKGGAKFCQVCTRAGWRKSR